MTQKLVFLKKICLVISGTKRRKSASIRTSRQPRIPFTPFQQATLERKFQVNHYLTAHAVSELSVILNLSKQRIKIWYQNRRARERREELVKEEQILNDTPPEYHVNREETISTQKIGVKDQPASFLFEKEEVYSTRDSGVKEQLSPFAVNRGNLFHTEEVRAIERNYRLSESTDDESYSEEVIHAKV